MLASITLPRVRGAPGSLTGTVADASGGRLPGVTVDVKSGTPARTVASAVTNGEGSFHVESMAPGNYIVEFLLSGFAAVRQPVRVDAGATAVANATLSIGGLSETVQVSASAVELEVSADDASQSLREPGS